MEEERFEPAALRRFAGAALEAVGLPAEGAGVVAAGLVEADLYGHTTHGLALLSEYIAEIERGEMRTDGEPEVVAARGAVACWDARRLPGIWVTARAVDAATSLAGRFGIGAVAVRRSHHIGCLASFLEAPARRGFLVLVFSSDPSDAHVAPFGGRTPVMTPNPIAAGIPRSGEPIMIDISTAITTAGQCGRARTEGRRLPGKWLLDADGTATDDPEALRRGGSILPVGGLDHGHKGFGLSLLVEALTQGIGGYGRAERPTGWGAGVLVVALAPEAFGSAEEFLREVDWLAATCLRSAPARDRAPVRLPGQSALRRKAEANRNGLVLYPGLAGELRALGRRLGIPAPSALG